MIQNNRDNRLHIGGNTMHTSLLWRVAWLKKKSEYNINELKMEELLY